MDGARMNATPAMVRDFLAHDRFAGRGVPGLADVEEVRDPATGALIAIRGEMRVARVGEMQYPGHRYPVQVVDDETLTDAESHRSLRLVPMFFEHAKPGARDASNTHRERIGQVGEAIRFDGTYLIAPYVIDTARGIQLVRDLGIDEVSPEYVREFVDLGDGRALTRNRRYHRVVVTRRARGGRDIVLAHDGDTMENQDTILQQLAAMLAAGGTKAEATADSIADAIGDLAAQAHNAEEAAKALADVTAERDDLAAKLEAANDSAADLLAGRGDAARALFAGRARLVEAAGRLGVEDGAKLDNDGLRAAIAKSLDLAADSSADVIDGAVMVALRQSAKQRDPRKASLAAGKRETATDSAAPKFSVLNPHTNARG